MRKQWSRHLTALTLAALMTGCSGAADDVAGSDPTAGEAAELDAAAERLDARAPSPGAAGAAELEQDVRARLANDSATAR